MPSIDCSRRSFLGCGAAGSVALALSRWGTNVFAAAPAAKAKACIFVYLEGGPTHIDTFDPKPGQDTGGPFTAIDTKIPGVQFSQHFPLLAGIADKLAVIRSLTSKEGDHERAAVLVHTGYSPSNALDYPSLGSIVAHEAHATEAAGGEASDAPAFVSFGSLPTPGYLGPAHGPYVVSDVYNPGPNLSLPEGLTEKRMVKRIAALEMLNGRFAARTNSRRPGEYSNLSRRSNRLRQSPALQNFDFAAEEPELWRKYGGEINDGFARSCMHARRMIENGVKFVEVNHSGWDTHADNFNQVQALAAQLDAGLATLIDDLDVRGLLEQTLVVCLGEFGRTPTINGDNGRDHWSDVFSALVAGGGLKCGQAIGASDEKGAQVKDRPVTIPDLHATLFTALGIDPAKEYATPDGRPIQLTNGGKAIRELLS